jgi:hypothetical protein
MQPWDELRSQLETRGLPANARTFIASRNWRRAGQLNTLFGADIPVLCLCRSAKHLGYVHAPADYAGWTGILIDVPNALSDDTDVTGWFETLTAPEDISLTRQGKVVYPLSLRVGTGYLPP